MVKQGCAGQGDGGNPCRLGGDNPSVGSEVGMKKQYIENKFMEIWECLYKQIKEVKTKNRENLLYSPYQGSMTDGLTIGEKVDAILDFLEIKVVKTYQPDSIVKTVKAGK
jgi:hypothetical protein